MIYCYALSEPGETFLLDTLIPPALARVSKGLRAECLIVFLRENHFCVLFMEYYARSRYRIQLAPLTSMWLLKLGEDAPVLRDVSFAFSGQDLHCRREMVRFYPNLDDALAIYGGLLYHLQYDVQRRAVEFSHGSGRCRLCTEPTPPDRLGLFSYAPVPLIGPQAIAGRYDLLEARSHHAVYMAKMNKLCSRAFSIGAISVGQLSTLAGAFLQEAIVYLHRSTLTFNVIERTHEVIARWDQLCKLHVEDPLSATMISRQCLDEFDSHFELLEDFYHENWHVPP